MFLNPDPNSHSSAILSARITSLVHACFTCATTAGPHAQDTASTDYLQQHTEQQLTEVFVCQNCDCLIRQPVISTSLQNCHDMIVHSQDYTRGWQNGAAASVTCQQHMCSGPYSSLTGTMTPYPTSRRLYTTCTWSLSTSLNT